jgi:N-acetylmuramic acid 6-phosphate etherase
MAATDRDGLVTEAGGANADVDLLSSHELVELMNDEDEIVAPTVRAASVQIAEAIDAIVERLERGGRLIYVGAGTSGALAQLDAAECETTFSAPPSQVIAVVAGSGAASSAERDAAEDDERGGARDIEAAQIGPQDAVVAVSASGRTPYAVGALHAAAKTGALTAAVVSAPGSELAAIAHHEISVVVGPEVLAGSTRLKAGTAQKLVLNTISTVTMIRLGKTYKNLMVDVRGTNAKLRARVESIVRLATGAEPDEVHAALEAAGGDAKVAIVSLIADVDVEVARARLEAAGGRVRVAVDS